MPFFLSFLASILAMLVRACQQKTCKDGDAVLTSRSAVYLINSNNISNIETARLISFLVPKMRKGADGRT